MKMFLLLIFISIYSLVNIYPFQSKKDQNWRNGLNNKSKVHYDKKFFDSNENYIKSKKITNDNKCGVMIGNEICLKNFDFSATSCFDTYKRFIFFNRRHNKELYEKMAQFKNLNNYQAKYKTINLSNNEINILRDCVMESIYKKLKAYFNRYKRSSCYKYKSFDDLPLEVKTSVLAIGKKLPSIFESSKTKIKGNFNDNFLNCNFKKLSNNMWFIGKHSENKVYYSNLSNILKSLENPCKNNRLRIILLIDESGSINNRSYLKLINFSKTLVDKIYNPKLEIGVVFFSTYVNATFHLKHYSKNDLINKLNNRRRKIGTTNTSAALSKALGMINLSHAEKDSIPPQIILFSDGNSNNARNTINMAKQLHRKNVTISVVKIGNFSQNELMQVKSKNGSLFSLDNMNQLNSILSLLIKKSCNVYNEIKLDQINNKLKNNKISKNSEVFYKLSIPKNKILEVKLEEFGNNKKPNLYLGNVIGSINYPNLSCLVNNVDKYLKSYDNKVYFTYDFVNSWTSKNINYANCGNNFDLNLHHSPSTSRFNNLFLYELTKFRNANDKLNLVKNEEYIRNVKNNNSNYNVYLIIKSHISTSLNINFKLYDKYKYTVKNLEDKNKNQKKPEPKKPVIKKPEPKKPETKKPETKKPVIKKPEPKKPEPKKPETKKPETKKPEIKKPETKKPEIKKPETKKPEIKKPETKKPEIKKPEIKKPETKKPEPKKPEPKKPETKKPEIKKPEIMKPETKKPEIKKPEIKKPETKKPEIKKPEIMKPETKKPETKKPEIKKPEIKKPETKKPEIKKPETKKPEPKKPEPKKPETKKPEIKKPEIMKPETKKPEPKKPEPKKPETKKPEIKKPEIMKPETKKPETKKPEIKKPEIKKPETKKPEIKKPEIKKPETKKPEIKKPESKKPEPKKPEIKKPESKKPEPKKPEIKKPEPKKPEIKLPKSFEKNDEIKKSDNHKDKKMDSDIQVNFKSETIKDSKGKKRNYLKRISILFIK